MLQFIPLTDEDLERDPSLYFRLVPFNLDYPCRRLEVDVSPLQQNKTSALAGGELGIPTRDTQKPRPCRLGLDVHVSDGPERESPARPDQYCGDFRAVVNE